jgi:predicted HicB family RNase H-like nuclease
MKKEIKTVRINPRVWHEAKVAAVTRGQTLGAFLEELIRKEVEQDAKVQGRTATT